ncbi:MAG: hypothetical protein BWX84_02293 [Verrucomicrobia bacterium ADurb.Bin118]|nr:MAG: hypothetical protein BWX84_02293 [Verrucomicrobia bacterium ADurb.Bin118]
MVVVMIVTRKDRRDRVCLKEAAESVAQRPAGFDPLPFDAVKGMVQKDEDIFRVRVPRQIVLQPLDLLPPVLLPLLLKPGPRGWGDGLIVFRRVRPRAVEHHEMRGTPVKRIVPLIPREDEKLKIQRCGAIMIAEYRIQRHVPQQLAFDPEEFLPIAEVAAVRHQIPHIEQQIGLDGPDLLNQRTMRGVAAVLRVADDREREGMFPFRHRRERAAPVLAGVARHCVGVSGRRLQAAQRHRVHLVFAKGGVG